MSAFPSTALLDGIKWSFHPCLDCTDGARTILVIGKDAARPSKSRSVSLDCRTCEGRAYLRTMADYRPPSR